MHKPSLCVVSQHSSMPLSGSNSMSTQQLSMVLEARQFAQRVQDKLDAQFLEEVSSKSTLRVIDAAGQMRLGMGFISSCDALGDGL